jgi:CheY-like chemotaxis protein
LGVARILCVDDSESIRGRLHDLLTGKGHTVELAHNVMAGIRLIRRGSFDLILMDLEMPEIRGDNAVRVMRQRMAVTTPVVILSSRIQRSTIEDLRPLGVTAFVTKSRNYADKLMQEVDNALALAPENLGSTP